MVIFTDKLSILGAGLDHNKGRAEEGKTQWVKKHNWSRPIHWLFEELGRYMYAKEARSQECPNCGACGFSSNVNHDFQELIFWFI